MSTKLQIKWPFYPTGMEPRGWTTSSRIVLSVVGAVCRIWAVWANKIEAHNIESLMKALKRHPSTPLITYSNHHSCFDDPLMYGVCTWRQLTIQSHRVRWILGASDICFTRPWHTIFFAMGRCVPVVRGGGVYQQGIDFMIEKLNAGEWVHMFPEGRVNMSQELLRLKWGIGRMIAECKNTPMVLPMWHVGMETILQNKKPYIPRVGKRVTLLIGEPIDLSSTLNHLTEKKASPMEIRKVLTDYLQVEFFKLKEKAEAIHRKKMQ